MLLLGGIQRTYRRDAFQSSQCNFKIMKPSKYSALFPLGDPWWVRVNTSVSLYCWMGHLFLVFCRSDWVRLLDSCAGTDLELCCQDREPFFFFFNPAAPRALLRPYRRPLPRRSPVTNTRRALTAHFALAWQTLPALVLLAGSASEERVCPAENAGWLGPLWLNLKSPKSKHNWLCCAVVA